MKLVDRLRNPDTTYTAQKLTIKNQEERISKLTKIVQAVTEIVGPEDPKELIEKLKEWNDTITLSKRKLAILNKTIKEYRDRLQFDPGGSDKIDELEQALQFKQHDLNCTKEEVLELRTEISRLVRLQSADCAKCGRPVMLRDMHPLNVNELFCRNCNEDVLGYSEVDPSLEERKEGHPITKSQFYALEKRVEALEEGARRWR